MTTKRKTPFHQLTIDDHTWAEALRLAGEDEPGRRPNVSRLFGQLVREEARRREERARRAEKKQA